jgi:catechol 2,3-dioxygenase-like lactoylglutathione lyase family enzyme
VLFRITPGRNCGAIDPARRILLDVAITLNHTIVAARDKKVSANFLTELFGLPEPTPFGHFLVVSIGSPNPVSLDYADVPDGDQIHPQHYAFLVSEDDFDQIYGRILTGGLEHWADPRGARPGEINRNDGGRGVYFEDPSGHRLEILTRPYGSGG